MPWGSIKQCSGGTTNVRSTRERERSKRKMGKAHGEHTTTTMPTTRSQFLFVRWDPCHHTYQTRMRHTDTYTTHIHACVSLICGVSRHTTTDTGASSATPAQRLGYVCVDDQKTKKDGGVTFSLPCCAIARPRTKEDLHGERSCCIFPESRDPPGWWGERERDPLQHCTPHHHVRTINTRLMTFGLNNLHAHMLRTKNGFHIFAQFHGSTDNHFSRPPASLAKRLDDVCALNKVPRVRRYRGGRGGFATDETQSADHARGWEEETRRNALFRGYSTKYALSTAV